jgi:hypothetical protein
LTPNRLVVVFSWARTVRDIRGVTARLTLALASVVVNERVGMENQLTIRMGSTMSRGVMETRPS